jgi:serine/threonine protein kinase
LGGVAYYLLTGQPPFSGLNVFQLLKAHAGGEVAPPSTVNAEVPSDLEQVILRCLEKNPDDRFPDAASLGKALDACECATDWTVEAASTWWDENQDATEQTANSESQPIDVTIDLKPDDTMTG